MGRSWSKSSSSAAETAQWMEGIAEFVREWGWLAEAHLVNFFKDRAWEWLDSDWMQCLSKEPIPSLLGIPSGFIHPEWPTSLKAFLTTVQSLSYPRQPEASVTQPLPLGGLVSEGMSPKKHHEVKHLSSLVHSLILEQQQHDDDMLILDVGAGQGYLSQALCFQYKHPHVLAIDASSHNGSVTCARAARICQSHHTTILPHTITCNVESVHTLTNLITSHSSSSVLLAGLHACGDLSVTMLNTFLESPQVKALVSIGCCYNLLSPHYAFPLSRAAKSTAALSLPKNLRDLACQSAERWKFEPSNDAITNFDLHAFRAAFQMVLDKFYPQVMMTSPSIGRQGKALRRRHLHKKSNDNTHCSLFTEYSHAGLARLSLKPVADQEFHKIWNQVEPYMAFIGPYCSLRAALGPLIETYILLDRLLFLQEQQGDSIQAIMLPIFDPQISPRNLAIIAVKKKHTHS